MSVVERGRAPEPCRENRRSRNQDIRHPQRFLAWPRHPVSRSTWPADFSHSAHHMHRRPIYVSFVSKATLWDRGLCNYTAHTTADHRPLLCPRFLSHVKACPEDLKPPCFLRSKYRPLPPSQGKTQSTGAVNAPKSQVFGGSIHLNADRRKGGVQNQDSITRRRSAVVVPCLPLCTMSPSSINKPTPPQQSSPQPESGRQDHTTVPVVHTSLLPHPAPVENKEYHQEEASQPNLASVTNCIEPDWKCDLGSAGPEVFGSFASLSHGSLSDFSRPPSSLFSRSTDLASGRSSVWSDKTDEIMESAPLDIICFSPSQSSTSLQIPVAPCPPAESHQFSPNITTTPPLYKKLFGQTKPVSHHPPPPIHPHSDKPLSRNNSALEIGTPCQDASADAGLSFPVDFDQGLATLTFPSTPWSSCSSPQLLVPCSVSPKQTPSPPFSRLEAHRWPVLPPISSVRERCSTAASGYSELSCSQSHVFDELEAIAPRSTSCPSLDQPSDSSHCPSPDTDLSSGLAALTVGCDSGNLGSLSRVQLLLLNRQEPDTIPSPSGFEEDLLPVEMWPDLKMQNDYRLNSAGVLRPLTAGSISERCDSTGKVLENKLEESEGGSPSSWIIDPSPSHNMFSSSDSTRQSSHGSNTGYKVSTEEESNYPGLGEGAKGRSHEGLQYPTDEKDRRMEERKTKVLQMLSKLQDDTPHQPNSHKGHSNFEDFDFLAKYCIFSQEKLVEYKRAFEEEDSDGDGYISCLQVLLALRTIVPPELLSEEEEIYVYRILEMVDLRVTDGLVDLRLFAVIASLAQKIATMDDFMRSLISSMDFRSLEVRVFKAKKLFLFLLEEQAGEAGVQQGFISAEQLLLELKAGGIYLEQEEAIRLELQHIPPLDLVDFLAYLPLFMLIHKSVIANPLDDSNNP